MSDYATVWPGSTPPPGYAPMSAMQALSGRQPMFDAHKGPMYTGPFNAGTPADGIMHMILPQLLQMLTGNKHMAGQFFPVQQVYDQMEAQKHFMASQEAMKMASRRDLGTINSMIGGVRQMVTGRPLTDVERAQNYRVASGVSNFLPLLTNMLGPDMVDQLHGSRGSATVFAQQLHHAMRTGIDPISRTVGYSGESAGKVAQEVFERTFGPGTDIGAMKGLSAGQAGILANELQARGMLGQPLGTLPLREQRAAIPRELRADVVNRLAEHLPAIQDVLRSGGTPNEDMLERSRQSIRDTHRKMIDPSVSMSLDDLKDNDKLPGAEDIIRSSDSDRISKRLKNMAGAVKAMRDIFGDMGNPNAPMREIINGLEALTQGGIATMNPGDLEMMVRRTHTIARQTGMGVEGLLGLTAQGTELTDKLGLDRSYAVTIAQQSALFGAAAGQTLRLDVPTWGAASKEQLTLADQQLRTHAAASPLANQLNAVMRMVDTGVAAPKADTELYALVEAIRNGETEYKFGGKQNSVLMPNKQIRSMLMRDADVSETESYAMLSDMTGNQEAGQKYNTKALVRKIGVSETIRKVLRPAIGNRVRGILEDEGIDKVMSDAGIDIDDKELRKMSIRIGQGVGTDFGKMDALTVRTPAAKREYLGKSFRDRLRAEISAKLPNADEAEIDAIMDKAMNQKDQSDAGSIIQATINQAASRNPAFRTDVQMHNIMSLATMNQADSNGRQGEIAILTQSALAGLGSADPIRRLSDVFQSADKDSKLEDIVATALGGISIDAVNAADPNGELAQVFGLVKANSTLDPTDPKQLEQARRNSDMLRGLIEGGESAKTQLQRMEEDIAAGKIPGNDLLRRHLTAASQRDSDTGLLGDLGYQLSAAVSTDQVKATVDTGKSAEDILSDEAASAADRTAAASKFILVARDRGKQLLRDERSMKIIGQGGLELIQGTISDADRLRQIIQDESSVTGHEITFDDLLSGKNGVSDERHTEANDLFEKMRADWGEIAKRRGYGMIPGKGDDPENKSRAPMTSQEEEDLASQQAFDAQYETPASRAEAAVDELASIATADQRQRLTTDVNRKTLTDALMTGDRGSSVFRAVRSRRELLEMGISKNVFGGKTKLDELTDDEESSVMDRLDKVDMSDSERKDKERLRKESIILDGFGDQSTSANDITDDAIKRIKQAPIRTQDTPALNTDKEVKMVVTGTVSQRDDGKADLALEGKSLMNSIMSALGF